MYVSVRVADQCSETDLVAAASVASASGMRALTHTIQMTSHMVQKRNGSAITCSPVAKYSIMMATDSTTLATTDTSTTRPCAHWMHLNHTPENTPPITADTPNMPERAARADTALSKGERMSRHAREGMGCACMRVDTANDRFGADLRCCGPHCPGRSSQKKKSLTSSASRRCLR